MQVRYSMIYLYRNNHNITVNSFNEYFANCACYQIRETPNITKSFLLKRSVYRFKRKGVQCQYSFGGDAKLLKQCLLNGQNNALSHSRRCVKEIAIPSKTYFAERELRF